MSATAALQEDRMDQHGCAGVCDMSTAPTTVRNSAMSTRDVAAYRRHRSG